MDGTRIPELPPALIGHELATQAWRNVLKQIVDGGKDVSTVNTETLALYCMTVEEEVELTFVRDCLASETTTANEKGDALQKINAILGAKRKLAHIIASSLYLPAGSRKRHKKRRRSGSKTDPL